MNGPAILTFSLSAVPTLVEKLLADGGTDRDSVDAFVFHQANKLMLDSLRKQCKIPPERFVIDLEDKGNTWASTIPIALVDARGRGYQAQCAGDARGVWRGSVLGGSALCVT